LNGTYALVVLVYGLCLTTAAAFWMHHAGEPWRRVRRTLYVFIGFVFLLIPVPGIVHSFSGLANVWMVPWMVPIEEALKLALIVRLGASGRGAFAICLLFGCFEVAASKAWMALAMPPSVPLSYLMTDITYAVAMHAATGLIYAEIAKVRRLLLFAVATLLHLINNGATLYTMGHADGEGTALGMATCTLAVILAVTIGFREVMRHLPIREAAPQAERETLAPATPFV
jgi:hypothetical protein